MATSRLEFRWSLKKQAEGGEPIQSEGLHHPVVFVGFQVVLVAISEILSSKKKKRTKTKKELPQQVGEANEGFGSNGGDAVMVDVELFQAGQVPQTEVLQLLNVVLLQVESHQLAQRGETHGAHLKSDKEKEHTVVMTSCPQEAEGTFRRTVSPV